MSVPYVPASTRVPEITIKGVILGVLLSIILGAANLYLGLKVGLTVSASIPAAVISMGILGALAGIFGTKHNILENNAVQTAASAGESLAAGVLFTVPALLLLGTWSEVHYLETTLIALAGGVLGVLFTVPLRRALIVEAELLFPEGVATSEVLKAGEAEQAGSEEAATPHERSLQGGAKMGVLALVVGAGVGFLFKGMQSAAHMWAETAAFGRRIGDRGVVAFGSDLSPALLGVGYIVGLGIAALVFLGGIIGWLVAIPIFSTTAATSIVNGPNGPVDWIADTLADGGGAVDMSFTIWSTQIRYMGVGAMLVGGLYTILKLRKPLGQAMVQGLRAANKETEASTVRTEQEFGMRPTFLAVLGMVVPITLLYWWVTKSLLIAVTMGGLMVVTGFLFSAVGAYMAGIVGSSNNPISGVTILTVLAAAFTLKFLGVDSELGPAATIMVAAVIACAGAIASDNMQDLKAGHLLGATPKRQQTMQVIGVSAAAFAMAPVLQILHTGFTIGEGLPAPQAGLMAAVSGFVFDGGLPVTMVAVGAAIAVALIVLDEILGNMGAKVRTPVMPVAVGIYLPVGLSAPIFIGGLVAYFTTKAYARDAQGDFGAVFWAQATELGGRTGLLFASGLIAGEAFLGIFLGIALASLDADRLPFALQGGANIWPGLIAFAYLIALLWFFARRPAIVAKAS